MFDPRLIQNLRRFSDHAEAAAYLDLIADVLETLGISNEDRRFHFNPRQDAQWMLPLTINHRYVACKTRDLDAQATWVLLHPGPHAALDVEAGEWLKTWAFARKRYDPPEGAPVLVQYRADFVREYWPALRPLVLYVAGRELQSCRGVTPYRHKHNSQAYALALDDATRAELLTGMTFTGSGRVRRKVKPSESD